HRQWGGHESGDAGNVLQAIPYHQARWQRSWVADDAAHRRDARRAHRGAQPARERNSGYTEAAGHLGSNSTRKTQHKPSAMIRRLLALAVVPVAVPTFAAEREKDLAAKCDAYMQARVRYSATRFSGSVLVAKDGKTIYEKGFGFANREYDIANTPQ